MNGPFKHSASEKLHHLIESGKFDLEVVDEMCAIRDHVETLEVLLQRDTKLNILREAVKEASPRRNVSVAMSAMREEELINLINRFDTDRKTAEEAYDQLIKLNAKTYRKL